MDQIRCREGRRAPASCAARLAFCLVREALAWPSVVQLQPVERAGPSGRSFRLCRLEKLPWGRGSRHRPLSGLLRGHAGRRLGRNYPHGSPRRMFFEPLAQFRAAVESAGNGAAGPARLIVGVSASRAWLELAQCKGQTQLAVTLESGANGAPRQLCVGMLIIAPRYRVVVLNK